jgi:cytochrome c oxidase subunit 2
MRTVLRIGCLFLPIGFSGIAGRGLPTTISEAGQDVQVIEVFARKYEYIPAPIRVKRGVLTQLKITSQDRTHGFKISVYADGADAKGDPGLIFSTDNDCFKIEKGAPTIVQFVARTAGTYSFHCCNRCGIGHGGMKGQLIVEP